MQFGYVIIYVKDVEATLRFYEQAFGFSRRFVAEGGVYGELETGETSLAFASEDLIEMQGLPFRRNDSAMDPAGAEVGLVSRDVPAAYEKALQAGATDCRSPTVKPWGQTVGYVRDNNGFLVEICSPMR